ncbi:hypothetical protein BKA67DRAFT_538631 [Truncatella angustata]|uniref:DUF2157 domain-containing protein n=1 Tax=Truncatella angustata TaxID=152316 RepID=A0A9P8ZVA8_9PEZI|nr:uncharacterized protein BKA67DRAFT_538631 [Truncatella angustata]KAH6648609.1 hypothetical protein BKA67DRAFT_538631 [Truncatella angustata]KAH8199488.1 hypothetical protein TruAng_006364 [Truncatella angustata]
MSPMTETKLTVSSSQARAVQAAIQQWKNQHLVSSSLASQLLETLNVEDSFDWQRFAKYSFRLAIICLAIAIFSILTDDAFLKLIRRVFSIPAWIRSLCTAAVAATVHYWGYLRQLEQPLQVWTNESAHALGGLIVAVAAWQLFEWLGAPKKRRQLTYESGLSDEEKGRRIQANKDQYAMQLEVIIWIVLLLAVVYGTTGMLTGSNLIWSTALLVLGTWLGVFTGYHDALATYSIYMEYPLRFVLFGLSLTGVGYTMRRWERTVPLWSSTRIWGLLYLFIALWILSLFGDDELFSRKKKTPKPSHDNKNRRLFVWSLIFGLAAGYCIVHGMKHDDGTTKGFGLAFLGINLYTRFFELFWHAWYKPLFFAVLAGTLAVMGRYAERVWNMQLQI